MSSLLTESAFQKRILQACQHEDRCHAIRVARMWAVMGGVPDLYIKHPDFPAIWLELKINHRRPTNGRLVVPLSPLQRHFMRRERDAGGVSGWAMLCQGHSAWAVYTGRNPEIVNIPTGEGRCVLGGVGPIINIRSIIPILQGIINDK